MKNIGDCLPEDSWFRDYLACWPASECPHSFILFSAMAMLGAALGRRVWMNQDVHKIYALMSLLLIGPSGVGKSTSLRDMAMENLLRPLPDELRPQIITGKSTKEALHDDLMLNEHSVILASELANFFSREKYMEGMVPYCTDLLDLAPTSVRTKAGSLKTIREPAVAIMGGSTKEWLQEQLPSTAAAGGFLPRFFIVKEDHKFQRVANPEGFLTRTQKLEVEKRRIETFAKFRAVVDSHYGPIEFEDYAATDKYGLWYQSYMPDSGILSPFAARAGVHILRISMLLALSSGRNAISARDVQGGICLFSYSMSKLQEVIVPMSATGKLINKVLEVIGEDSLSDAQIKRAMRNYSGRRDVEEALHCLIESKEIVSDDGFYRRTSI